LTRHHRWQAVRHDAEPWTGCSAPPFSNGIMRGAVRPPGELIQHRPDLTPPAYAHLTRLPTNLIISQVTVNRTGLLISQTLGNGRTMPRVIVSTNGRARPKASAILLTLSPAMLRWIGPTMIGVPPSQGTSYCSRTIPLAWRLVGNCARN